jgi:dCTP deaminase
VITSVLSDGTIRRLVSEGRIVIDPWDETLVQPASVDLRLGDSFRVFHNHRVTAIDLRDPPRNLTEEVVVPSSRSAARWRTSRSRTTSWRASRASRASAASD